MHSEASTWSDSRHVDLTWHNLPIDLKLWIVCQHLVRPSTRQIDLTWHSLPIDLKLWIVCQQPHCDSSSVLIQEVAIAQDGPQALTCIPAQPVVKDNWKTQREA